MKEHASFNRCYRLLWSGTTEQWKPVPETARTAKKGGRGSTANTLTLAGVLPGVAMSLFVMSNLAAQPPPLPPAPVVTQLPTGGTVVGGQATISQSAVATAANMVVNQTSQRAIIDWTNFNLGSAATVQFVQPNAQSVILNRVLDPNPTQVFGRINANGQVFLTNPYGVYFSPTASVDVGGLVATTYSISNADFMAGRYTFNRNGSTGRVVNDGNTNATVSVSAVNSTSLVGMGMVAGDDLNVSATGLFNNKSVGAGKTVNLSSAYTGVDAGNYNITSQVNTTADISQKSLNITGITAANKVYDGNANATVNVSAVNSTSLIGMGMIAGDDLNVSATGLFNNKNFGTGKTVNLTSSYTGVDAGNYNITSQVNTTANITTKTVTLTAPQANRAYDGTVNYTANVSQLSTLSAQLGVAGDNVTTITLAYNDKTANTGKTLTASNVVISDGNNGLNYNVSYADNNTSVITAKALTISGITAATKVYDGNMTAVVSTSGVTNTTLGNAGLIAGDDLTVTATGVFADKNVGTGKTVTLNSSYGGADASNYNITSQATTSANITQKSLTITGITAANKIYDGNANATVNVSAVNSTSLVGMGMVVGDDLNVSATGLFSNKNVGTGKTVILNSSYSGVDIGNYNITSQVNTTADISQKSLNITGITAANKIYDGNTNATVNVSSLNNTSLLSMGMVRGDNVSITATGAFVDKEVGTNKTVAISTIYAGVDAANYNIISQSSALADITAASKATEIDSATLAKLIEPPVIPPPAPVIKPAPVVMPPFTSQEASTPPVQVTAPVVVSEVSHSLSAMSGVQIRALTSAQLIAVTTAEISTLTPVQLQAFTSEQLTTFTAAQKQAFTPEQRAWMSARQIAAMNVMPQAEGSVQPDDSMTSQKALALVTQTRINVATTTVAVEKFEQSAGLTTTTTTTPTAPAVNAPMNVASVPPGNSEARTGAGTPLASTQATASTSGVLPVSILGDSRMSSVGMAYEEKPNDIRIQLTSSPEAPKPSSTVVRFTGNFKTFMVGNDRGEMVAYQGAMIGKRMVILAETEASKNLARKEMQTVLAAAITTLGSAQTMSLAQIEGVVLDLR